MLVDAASGVTVADPSRLFRCDSGCDLRDQAISACDVTFPMQVGGRIDDRATFNNEFVQTCLASPDKLAPIAWLSLTPKNCALPASRLRLDRKCKSG